ncbi:MAG TPA: glycosyltransferase [Bryobacteraceae bacterium]|nr:glycosyltransferase [Bryobacteraceae bacterium]
MKIRVLEVLATLKRAGAEHVASALACRLPRERFETAVVSLFEAFPQGLEPEMDRCGVKVRHLGKRPGLDLRMYPRLARAFREIKPDIIHSHSYVMRYVLPVGGRAALVHTVHNLAGREVEPFGQWVHRYAWRRGVTPVAVSDEVARSFRIMYGFDPLVIPNGIDTAAYLRPGARERWRRAHGVSEQERLVVSLARLDPQKNPLGLIEAFARVPNAHLVLAGGGSLLEAVRKAAGPRVRVLGVVEDVPELLAAADVFALASDWEGHPVSVLEAMAAGLPVAATAVGGLPEIVEEGVTGRLVPRGDMNALGHAIADALANRKEMGEAARRRAARHDVSGMISSYAELFEKVASR